MQEERKENECFNSARIFKNLFCLCFEWEVHVVLKSKRNKKIRTKKTPSDPCSHSLEAITITSLCKCPRVFRSTCRSLSILVSWGCCNKWAQTGWLRTTEIHSLSVLEARSLKSLSRGWNQGLAGLRSLQRLTGSVPSFLVPAYVACQPSFPVWWLRHSSFKANIFKSLSALSSHSLLSLCGLPPILSCGYMWLNLGLTWMIMGNRAISRSLITSARTLSHKVMFTNSRD